MFASTGMAVKDGSLGETAMHRSNSSIAMTASTLYKGSKYIFVDGDRGVKGKRGLRHAQVGIVLVFDALLLGRHHHDTRSRRGLLDNPANGHQVGL